MELSNEELNKTWLITGVCGQDGSWFVEYLLSKGYVNVHGIMRRAATFNTQNIDHIFDKLKLHYGDLTDAINIHNIIAKVRPDYIVHLGAMSHVKVSHDLENYTFQVNTLGTLSILQSVRSLGLEKKCKIYHASTSEQFGNTSDGSIMLNEESLMKPVSLYGISKKAAQEICDMYRDAYGMFIVSSVLFNHETISGNMPIIFKMNDEIDIKPISEIVKYHTRNNDIPAINESYKVYQECEIETDLEIWDNNKWTKVTYASGYPHDIENNPKFPKYIISKNAAYLATDTHPIIMEDNSEKEVQDIEIGDRVKLTKYPEQLNDKEELMIEEAIMYGLICGDGCVPNNKRFRIINSDNKLREYIKAIWYKICQKYNFKYNINYHPSKSSFNPEGIVGCINFISHGWILREQFYDEYKNKRVPKIILNSSVEIQRAFIEGYNMADGLKSTIDKTIYHFKRFKTNSPTLASGLLYLMSRVSPDQNYNINIDIKREIVNDKEKLSYYYALTFNSDSKYSMANSLDKYNKIKLLVDEKKTTRHIHNQTQISEYFIRKVKNGYVPDGKHHLQKEDNVVKKVIECYDYDGWFYDLETESGTFHCGIGQGVVHNSPRRGHTFVTQKIADYVAKYYKALNTYDKNKEFPLEPLQLGNLNARRDWGSAKVYMEAVYLMLQQEKPQNYVIATGETHSVREFVELAFKEIGIDVNWMGSGCEEVGVEGNNKGRILVQVNPKYYRDIDIECLIGDASKAKRNLGWSYELTLHDLVKEMVDAAIKRL